MYRPNFCAECGTRVERGRRRALLGGRFCRACAGRVGKRRFVAPALVAVCLIGLGFAVGSALRRPDPPLIVERKSATDETAQRAEAGKTESAGARSTASQVFGPDGTEAERPTDPLEVVSICGARTKKGAPCSRRVRGTGRCWQHRGKPAMLPAEKLIVPN